MNTLDYGVGVPAEVWLLLVAAKPSRDLVLAEIFIDVGVALTIAAHRPPHNFHRFNQLTWCFLRVQILVLVPDFLGVFLDLGILRDLVLHWSLSSFHSHPCVRSFVATQPF